MNSLMSPDESSYNVGCFLRESVESMDTHIRKITNNLADVSFYRLFYSMVVNECVLQLIIMDLFVNDNDKKLSSEYLIDETVIDRYKQALKFEKCEELVNSILFELYLKKNKRTDYQSIYERLYNYIIKHST